MGYCTRAQIEARWEEGNVTNWADLANDQDSAVITARIASVIEDITEEIDDRLRGGPHTVPFTTVPTMIRRLAVTLCGVELYEPRGTKEIDPSTGEAFHRLTPEKDKALADLSAIRDGSIRLDLDSTQDTPEVVTDD